ncbi:MAG TPA: NAD(+)/NADH kinase [Rubrobacteraceae bacterium]|nr:NAD(+)/NADH kinase [Rubrobacteraceae bacterium]
MGEGAKLTEVRRVGIVSNPAVSGGYFERLVRTLEGRGVEVAQVVESPDGEAGREDVDLVFVLGGDGTMLRASRIFPKQVLLGVNLGRVGFMSGMLRDDIEGGVAKVLDGGLHVQEYRMLEVRVEGEKHLAANDAVLIKQRPHQLVSIDVSVAGEELFAFRCDGFIAATPLGSTAYALSAGGPIISGDAECYVLVPIAPHALVSRPLVLGEDQVAELRLVERTALLSVDGGEPREIPAGGRVEIRLSRESVRIGRTDEWTWWQAVRRTFL